MTLNALNPNHAVTQHAQEMAMKYLAILVHKLGGKAEITEQDIRNFGDDNAIVVHGFNDKIVIRVMSHKEGEELACREGGLPT